jgi:S-DNA-T family DNA segregation ATPase FtsK/SpoIIIE
MAKNGIQQQNSPKLIQEALGVLGIFIALYLFVCLLSFSPSSSPEGNTTLNNWGGTVGYFLARFLFSFLGLGSYWLSILSFLFSLQLFSPKLSLQRVPYIFLGCSGIVLSSCGLLAVFWGQDIVAAGRILPSGGYLGLLIGNLFTRYLGIGGGYLFLFLVLLLSLMAAWRFSLYNSGRSITQLFRRTVETLRANSKRREQSAKDLGLQKNNPSDRPVLKVKEGESRGMPRLHAPVAIETDDDEDDFQPLPVQSGEFRLPSITLLDKPPVRENEVDNAHYFEISKLLEEKLLNFGVEGKVVGISPGPVITTYEFSPAPGVKINKIVSLADDLALGLKAESVRIVGSVPGKSALGIEIPNPERQIVHIRDILATEKFQKSPSKLTLGLGMDVVGNPVCANLAKMPHLLIAGATGAGKSVAINTIICSILMKATPDEVRLLMVDPKRIELSTYEDIPHLLHPVVVDPKMASRALQWAVREMERRYALMEELRVKNLASYNEIAEQKLPLVVIIIDELADLMMVSSREVEDCVARLAQMARAAGMHLILATQRPSVDVLTGLIKANFPTRMSFKVSSKVDSRTILDTVGAEHLLGSGDMLFLPPGASRLQRIHGAYISEKETERIVGFLKEQQTAVYDESVISSTVVPDEENGTDDDSYDEKYDEAVAMVCETGQASISMVQRRFRIGYNRAARMIEKMEKEGIVGPADGAKPREVLVRKSYS